MVEKFSGGDSDPGDENDDSDADSDDTDGPPSLTDLHKEVEELETKWRNGSFSNTEERGRVKRELQDAQNRRDRAQGWADACAALGR